MNIFNPDSVITKFERLNEAMVKATKGFRSFSKVIRRSGIEVKEFRLPRKQKKKFKKAYIRL